MVEVVNVWIYVEVNFIWIHIELESAWIHVELDFVLIHVELGSIFVYVPFDYDQKRNGLIKDFKAYWELMIMPTTHNRNMV